MMICGDGDDDDAARARVHYFYPAMPSDKWLREHRFAVIAATEEDGILEAIRAIVE